MTSVEPTTVAAGGPQYAAPPPRRTLAELCAIAELSEEGQAARRDGMAPKAYLARLAELQLFPDAFKVLSYSLPRREAVWWAWVCARKAAGGEAAPKVKAAIDAVERWIVQPTDENRRAAMQQAEVAGFGTPAGCAGLAAFFSGGSIAPSNLPEVAPGEFVTAKAVAGGVTLATVSGDPKDAPARSREYLALGIEVADRTKLWA